MLLNKLHQKIFTVVFIMLTMLIVCSIRLYCVHFNSFIMLPSDLINCTRDLSDFNQFEYAFLVYCLLRMHFERENSFKLLKTVFKLAGILTFSTYRAVNTVNLDYKSQQINIVQGNNRSFFW